MAQFHKLIQNVSNSDLLDGKHEAQYEAWATSRANIKTSLSISADSSNELIT